MDTKMKCADCRYWGAFEAAGHFEDDAAYEHGNVVGAKRCSKVVELWEATMWAESGLVMKPGLDKQLSFAMDGISGESFSASLWTRPGFFCAHFEDSSIDHVEPPPVSPETIKLFADYHRENPMWGSLHIVLDDHNVEDSSVMFCVDFAKAHDDAIGATLGELLIPMTRAQRLQLGDILNKMA